jgi:hypothetical protein
MATNLLQTLVKATGFNQGQEVDLWFVLWDTLYWLLTKLDADGGVTDTDYLDLCYVAMAKGTVRNSSGGRTGLDSNDPDLFEISPRGISAAARHRLLYTYTNAWETLCEKLDADGTVNDTDYEALCYTALFLHVVKDEKGVTDLGNGTVYYFTPGNSDREQLVEWFYNALNALETLTEQLDADSGVTDVDYESAVYETYATMLVRNAAGNTIGN